MKKIIFIYLVFFIHSFLYSSDWKYDGEKKELIYKETSFPAYSAVQTPIGFFAFIYPFRHPFYGHGWYQSDLPRQENQNNTLSPETIARGWAIGVKAGQIPNDWIYFPEKELAAHPDSFMRLYRLWDRYYERIEMLHLETYNFLTPGNFYSIITPYYNNKIIDISLEIPKNFILMFEKVLAEYGMRKLFILYVKEKNQENTIDTIKLIHKVKNETIKIKKIRIMYHKDTQISF